MKVLVTGAGGVLGRQVLAHLRESGHSVRAHDRTPVDPALADEVAGGDLHDRARLAELFDGIDGVVHAAALPSPDAAPHDEVFTNNIQAAYFVLDAAGAAGVPRAVYISSLAGLGIAFSVHDLSPLFVPITEEHPYIGEDVYGLSKHVGETIAATVARRYGTTVVSIRFPFLGAGKRLRRHLDQVHSDPGSDRGSLWGWLDTRDAARAIGAALTAPIEGHPVINVAAPDTTALVPTEELLRRYHPTARLDTPLEGFAVPFSLRRSRELLDFTPLHTWRE